ncbi:MAG TPA: DUF1565 domain-containing protein, partial [Polyangiaceae bacterium]|nr:DUF1565 domain-containing protein [Polyangiaceae bacterium]
MKYLIGTMLGWMLPVCFVSAAQAADIYVDARNGGKENGTITAPYRTIGAAVKAASSGDRIQIAAGNYAENLHLKKPLTLQGGFVGAQAQTYAAGGSGDFSRSEPSKQESVINGNAEAPVILAEGTIETTLDGLVLRGGKSGVESSAYPED